MLRNKFMKGKLAAQGKTVTTDEQTARRLIGSGAALPVAVKKEKPGERDKEVAGGLNTKNAGALVP